MVTAEITASSTMQEVLAAYPGAQRALMRGYHIGGCSSCGFSPEEPLGDVLKRHNALNVDEVIEHIKASDEQERRIQVDAKTAAEERKGDNPPKLLDVRSPEEQAICMIDGAIPVTQELVQEMMSTWARDTAIIVTCHHGMRSLDAAAYFIGHGFTNVRSLTGGINAWAQDVEPGMARY